MNKVILLATLITMLSACGGGGNNDASSTSPLIGVWVTESCKQVSDTNGAPLNIWRKALYEFNDKGEVFAGGEQYSDSNCITLSNTQAPTEVNVPVTYQDHGSLTLQEGIDGGRLLIEIGSGNQLLSIDAFYTINNNSLCFSDAFTFEALGFGISQSGTDAIDFTKCLTKP